MNLDMTRREERYKYLVAPPGAEFPTRQAIVASRLLLVCTSRVMSDSYLWQTVMRSLRGHPPFPQENGRKKKIFQVQ